MRRTRGRWWNQVVKRCRAKGGSRRTLDTPVAFSMILRMTEPRLAVVALATLAVLLATLPMRSVRAMTLVVSRSLRSTSPLA